MDDEVRSWLEKAEEEFDELTPYAVETRYPGDAPVLSKGDARELLGRVGTLREDLLPRFRK